MKRAVQILACLLLSLGWQPVASWGQTLDAANAFVTCWQGEAGKGIRVPLYGSYAYRWEKADGTEMKAGVATVAEGELLELPVAEAGEYVLRVGPVGVKRIEFGVLDGERYRSSRGTPDALLRVAQWGRVAWESFAGAFYGCKNMRIAEGAGKPDLSGVQSMHSALKYCSSFNSPMEAWDVSNVASMREMFSGCISFNQPLERWDVSKVTDMEWMFDDCSSFNQPLGAWDMSHVTRVEGMFAWCSSFDQPLEKWDVSHVTSMVGMFYESGSFNQPLGGWTLSALARDEGWDHDLSLQGSRLDVANYSATLSAWAAKRDQLQDGVRVKADGLKCNAAGKAARQQLIDDKAWEFAGDGEATLASPAVEIVGAPAWLAVGTTHAFTAKVVPAEAPQAVTWSVEEGEEWATFAGNTLTAKREGTIIVEATSVAVPTSSQRVRIRVIAPVALTGITVSPTGAQLKPNETLQLTVGYTPADATNRAVTWSSSDASVATVDAQGKVTGVKGGTATITAKSADGGHTATCAVTVVADEKPSGVASVALAGVTVSPNPFGDHLTVRGAEGVLRYSLVSATGVVVLEGAHAGGDELMLATSRLPTGIYWLRLVAVDGERVVQVVRR